MRRLFLALGLAILPALPAAASPPVERVVSAKGIEAWLVQDHINPIIAMEFAFRGGSALDPADRAGLANMVSGLLDEGAGELDSYAFQKRLEDLSIDLSFSSGQDSFHGSLKTLTEHRDSAFSMMRIALTQPRFDDEPVQRIRSQILSGLAADLQNPSVVANRAWFALQFPDHPYGRPVKGTPESVKAITAADLRAFPAGAFGRDRLVVSVVGDITAEQLKPLLDQTFGDLPETVGPPAVAVTSPKANGRVQVIERNNPQSVVVFGHEGIAREDPEWFPAYVMNYILGGGGFSSRLFTEVREKRGLAYSVHSALSPFDYAPLIIGGVATANGRVAESLALIREEWRRMAEHGPTPAEMDDAKTYLTGSFPLQFDSVGAIAGILLAMQMDHLGIDYLEKRNALIEAVQADDVRKIAKRLLRPDRLAAVVVGQPDGLATH
ncbi:MAG: insulinase family protein [Alphaproteobacteria bacterium]|nr:insulinase family protein [Alphaproteobacteria bacterium]